LRQWGGGHNLERASRKAIASASVVGLITMPNKSAAEYFCGGRAVERLWLTAAELQLALHPMTSLPYLLMQFRTGDECAFDPESQATLQELSPRYRKLFPVPDKNAQVFLFRLSYADETTRRSLRRDLDNVFSINSA